MRTSFLTLNALAAIAAVVLLAPALAIGGRLFSVSICAVMIAWNLAFAALAEGEERQMWIFAALTSLFQPLPDWFLATVLKTIHFKEVFVPKFGGAVPAYMAAMCKDCLANQTLASPLACSCALSRECAHRSLSLPLGRDDAAAMGARLLPPGA
jgi:hypothetical protein